MQDQDVTLGEIYTDEVTSFAGIATGKSEYLGDDPSLIQLENAQNARWIPVSRCQPASDEVKDAVTNGQFSATGTH